LLPGLNRNFGTGGCFSEAKSNGALGESLGAPALIQAPTRLHQLVAAHLVELRPDRAAGQAPLQRIGHGPPDLAVHVDRVLLREAAGRQRLLEDAVERHVVRIAAARQRLVAHHAAGFGRAIAQPAEDAVQVLGRLQAEAAEVAVGIAVGIDVHVQRTARRLEFLEDGVIEAGLAWHVCVSQKNRRRLHAERVRRKGRDA